MKKLLNLLVLACLIFTSFAWSQKPEEKQARIVWVLCETGVFPAAATKQEILDGTISEKECPGRFEYWEKSAAGDSLEICLAVFPKPNDPDPHVYRVYDKSSVRVGKNRRPVFRVYRGWIEVGLLE